MNGRKKGNPKNKKEAKRSCATCAGHTLAQRPVKGPGARECVLRGTSRAMAPPGTHREGLRALPLVHRTRSRSAGSVGTTFFFFPWAFAFKEQFRAARNGRAWAARTHGARTVKQRRHPPYARHGVCSAPGPRRPRTAHHLTRHYGSSPPSEKHHKHAGATQRHRSHGRPSSSLAFIVFLLLFTASSLVQMFVVPVCLLMNMSGVLVCLRVMQEVVAHVRCGGQLIPGRSALVSS